MSTYKLHYRRPGQWFFRTLHLKAHSYLTSTDRLFCELPNGRVRELPEWTKCEVKYGQDLIACVKAANRETQHDHVPGAQDSDHV